MTDLKCGKCHHYADEVKDISWNDGYSWAEVIVYCKDCNVESTHEFREPYVTVTHDYSSSNKGDNLDE